MGGFGLEVDCQVCGRQAVGEGVVEGARVPLCENCSDYASGFKLFAAFHASKQQKPPSQFPSMQAKPSGEEELVEDYGKKIMQAREKLKLSRKQLAAKIFIQEKELDGFEQQKFKPGEAMVKKLEFALGISLREQAE